MTRSSSESSFFQITNDVAMSQIVKNESSSDVKECEDGINNKNSECRSEKEYTQHETPEMVIHHSTCNTFPCPVMSCGNSSSRATMRRLSI